MAEFKDFVKQFKRMCNTYNNECSKCPLTDHRGVYLCFRWCFEDPKLAEEVIMKWAEQNPVMTNRDKFIEVFGNEPLLLDIWNLKGVNWLLKEYKEPEKND